MKNQFKSLLILAVLFYSINSFASEKMRIAIIDFTAQDIARTEAAKVSELIRNEMINTGEFTIVERAQMGAILNEQGLQQTGCTDVSCAVEIGKMLSTRKIIVGTVMKMGDSIIITGRLVDVEKGIAEFSEKAVAKSRNGLYVTIEKFVNKLTKRITGNTSLFTEKEEPEEKKPVVENSFTYSVSTDFNYMMSLSDLKKISDSGIGGTLSVTMDIFGNLYTGLASGYYSFSGKEAVTDSLSMVPILVTTGYRFDIVRGVSITPFFSGGAVVNMLSQDSDGIPTGGKAEYETKTAVEPFFQGGLALSYTFSNFNINTGAGYSIIGEGDGLLSFISINFGIGLRF